MKSWVCAALVSATLGLSACGEASEKADRPAVAANSASPENGAAANPDGDEDIATTHDHADWAGRWIGQEGLYADITPTEPHTYKLQMQLDLDTDATYVGTDADGGIAFEWKGETRLLRKGAADEINLKWVDGADCLIVEEFVGFCRDNARTR